MPENLELADARIRSEPTLAHTVAALVAHGGDIVFENYYRDVAATELQPVHSLTKVVTSTLVGILTTEGLVDLDVPIASLLPLPAFDADPRKQVITVRHLLTMTSGLYGDGWWNIDEVADRGQPWVQGALEAPLVSPPGWGFLYNNGAAHVLSAVIEAAAGMPVTDFAVQRLFGPLGIDPWRWPCDPQGRPWGYGGLELTARDLVKVGLLYMAGGTWHQRRVVDDGYLRLATSPLTPGGAPEWCRYGFLWWVMDQTPPALYFGAGWGGQYLVVVPELDVVIVTLSDATTPGARGLAVRELIVQTIVRAFQSRSRDA